MDILFLIARILVGGYYLFNASNHFMQLEGMSQYAASKKVPAPKLAVAGTGVLLLVGGLSILLGAYQTLGVAALVIFFLGITFKMHNFWTVQDPMARMGEMVHFTKNMALMASAVMFLFIPTPWPFSLGG